MGINFSITHLAVVPIITDLEKSLQCLNSQLPGRHLKSWYREHVINHPVCTYLLHFFKCKQIHFYILFIDSFIQSVVIDYIIYLEMGNRFMLINIIFLSPRFKKFGKIWLGTKLSLGLIYDLSFLIQAASYFPQS